jgi:hypothetical protein
MAQGGHLRHRSNRDSYVVVKRNPQVNAVEGLYLTPFGQSCLSTTPAVVDGVRRMGVAQPVNRSGGVDAGALARLFDDKVDGTLGQWIAGLPNGPEHSRRRRRIAAVGKQASGDHRGDQHLAALTALADDRELCLPQPDSNLTATCHSGFSPIGGPSAGWLHFSIAA